MLNHCCFYLFLLIKSQDTFHHVCIMLEKVLQSSCWYFGKIFVNIWAHLSSVCIFSNYRSPSSKTSWIQWYLISMCFVFSWKEVIFRRWIALCPSQFSIYCSCRKSSSSKNLLIQIISLNASVVAIYSAFVVERGTIFYSLDTHEIVSLANV